jgi:arylsulfatase A-like enzyme
VVVTADHGEEFNEHGEMFHRRARLFDELLHVPLIIWCPSRYSGGQVVDVPVSLVDVTPTILDIAGAPLPKDSDGRSLEPMLWGDTLPQRVTISEVDGSLEARHGTVRAVRSARYKLIESSLDGSRSLFDLANDPGETTDVGAGVPHEMQALEAHVAPLPSPVPTPLSSEQSKRDAAVLERLRALGYFQ